MLAFIADDSTSKLSESQLSTRDFWTLFSELHVPRKTGKMLHYSMAESSSDESKWVYWQIQSMGLKGSENTN